MQPHRRIAVFLLPIMLSACSIGGRAPGDAGSETMDATLVRWDAAALGCDAETGEGCACPEVGVTRGCSTGGVGACGMGTQLCTVQFEFPTWGPCADTPSPTDETCDGTDEDCDGSTDEGLGELTCGQGPCSVTVPACTGGVTQTCVPREGVAETCDGTDEDCDGVADNGFEALRCGTGACEISVAACAEGQPGVCTPGTPDVETCNGADDDCDGSTDEGQGNFTCGVGACTVTVPACVGGRVNPCTPRPAGSETCDGTDDDCDGTIDEGFGTTVCGVGECRRVVLDCGGGTSMTCTPGTPRIETCDGADNDCDGRIDESLGSVSCGTGACARTQPACVGGTSASCTPGAPSAEACDGVDNDCDGMTDEGIATVSCGIGACRNTVPGCTAGRPTSCTPLGPAPTDTCGNRIDDDCDGAVDEACGCDVTVDRDFDTFNECVDCDDRNGAVHPRATEVCNGIDEDCDLRIDETFDGDRDGYATCTNDPLLRDCDDTRMTVHPGAMEDCGPAGTGNGIDEDCDGYVDDGCNPCRPTDGDGDGVSECMGDCDDSDPTISPTLPERCDGRDTDCNAFTIRNCGVSESCNFASGADDCEPDLLCACAVNSGGTCTGNYICSSFCEGSYTGPLGAGCTSTQTCAYRVTLSDNLHGCAENTSPVGTRRGGEVCTSNAQCRSLNCGRYCVGMGCSTDRCIDYCDHHDPGADGSCATGTVCEIVSSSFMSPYMYATCRLDDNGTGTTGSACSSTSRCRWGTQSCVSGVCAEPCGLETHCPSGTHCSLFGNSVSTGTWGGTGVPSYVGGQPAVETVPVCLSDTGTGLHNRQGGAACTQNGDCRSQFCERTLGVCVDLCTSDSSCPSGLDCAEQYVRAASGVLLARVCVSTPISALLERR